ncbi:hypothetical protein DOY81_005841, partial [Sarcophaga bullata]
MLTKSSKTAKIHRFNNFHFVLERRRTRIVHTQRHTQHAQTHLSECKQTKTQTQNSKINFNL